MPVPEYKLTVLSPDGDKPVHVRTPSEAEWSELQRARPLILRDLGRNQSEQSIPDSPEADLKLYEAIRMDGSANLDEYEAGIIIRQIERFDVKGVEREGGEFIVSALTAGDAEFDFRIRIFSARDLVRYRKDRATSRTLQHGVSRIHLHLSPAVELFDRYSQSGTDYSAIWKARVCDAVASAIEQMTSGGGENFR